MSVVEILCVGGVCFAGTIVLMVLLAGTVQFARAVVRAYAALLIWLSQRVSVIPPSVDIMEEEWDRASQVPFRPVWQVRRDPLPRAEVRNGR